MHELPISRLLSNFGKLSTLAQVISNTDEPYFYFSDEEFSNLIKTIEDFSLDCKEMTFDVTFALLIQTKKLLIDTEKIVDPNRKILTKRSIDALHGSLNTINQAIRAEASTKFALILSREKAHLYSPLNPIWPEFRTQFQAAIYDIDEAAKCLALGRTTAAVFHLMKIVELCLRAAVKYLKIDSPINPNWGIQLNAITTNINDRGAKWELRDFFRDLTQHLYAIKDAQRNATMHVETVYTQEEAELIFKNTESFCKKIAKKMNQAGEPTA